ncbi:MAG: AAA family ATPase [Methylobacter sp.]|jgi:DamX protein
MVDDDIFTYQGKPPLSGQANTAVPPLISKERMQKLELLIHLTSNLTQPLALCGPEGIGKTTLLKVFQERKVESWLYCPVSGNADLSFEAIQGQLAQVIKQDKTDTPVSSLAMAFERYANQHKQIVLIIDNAGELMPGLVTTIIRYAAANPVLRVIFALTHDELQVKQGSDRAVDDCHVVEIPYLSAKQCGEFLQQLAAKPAANGSVRAISESMIENVYQKTNGIPGRIVAEFARLFGAKKSGKLKWILIAALVISIAVALGVQWLASSKNKQTTSTAVEQKVDSVEITPSQPEPHVAFELPPPVQPVINPPEQSVQINEDIPPDIEDEEDLEPSGEISAATETKAKPEAAHAAVIEEEPENKKFGATATTTQTGSNPPEQSKQVKEDVLVKDKAQAALESSTEANAHKSDQAAAPAVKPEASAPRPAGEAENAAVMGQKQENKEEADSALPLVAESLPNQETSKQPENKAANEVVTPAPEKAKKMESPKKQKKPAVIPKEKAVKKEVPEEDGTGWLLTQPVENYTLQLMVSSKQPSLKDIRKKYPMLGQGFRIIKTVADGKETFILLYGSFNSAKVANTVKQSLSADFRNASARKISSLK